MGIDITDEEYIKQKNYQTKRNDEYINPTTGKTMRNKVAKKVELIGYINMVLSVLLMIYGIFAGIANVVVGFYGLITSFLLYGIAEIIELLEDIKHKM